MGASIIFTRISVRYNFLLVFIGENGMVWISIYGLLRVLVKACNICCIKGVTYRRPIGNITTRVRYDAFGWVAQLVEQRIENPRVAGSSPAPTTTIQRPASAGLFFTL